jgi:hypothetical protein
MKKKGGKKVPNCVPKEEMEIESYFNQLMGEWADTPVTEISVDDLANKVGTESARDQIMRKLADLKPLKMDAWKSGEKDMLQHIVKKENELKKALEALPEASPSAPEDEAVKEQQTPLSEFILSFYDRSTGAFPKGETAVLTMVEKDYGDEFVEPAKTFIERVNHTFEQYSPGGRHESTPAESENGEFDRIRHLAGL